jgi:hypothetical protein
VDNTDLDQDLLVPSENPRDHIDATRCDDRRHEPRKSRSPRKALCHLSISLVASLVITGCGRASSHERLSVTKYPIKYAPNGIRTLVREHMPGGYFTIAAKRYEYLGHTYSVLDDREEESGERRRSAGGGGGPDIENGQHMPLELDVSHGCLGRYAYAVAFGMLRDPRDSVAEQTEGTTTKFKAVVIPASFHPDGVLAYARLGRGSSDVVIRTPNGGVVSSESHAGQEAITCHNK